MLPGILTRKGSARSMHIKHMRSGLLVGNLLSGSFCSLPPFTNPSLNVLSWTERAEGAAWSNAMGLGVLPRPHPMLWWNLVESLLCQAPHCLPGHQNLIGSCRG